MVLLGESDDKNADRGIDPGTPDSPCDRRAFLVMYDGTDFSGWQLQQSARTVQGEIESVLTRLNGDRRVVVVGAGRTDAGVHARGQVAHADIGIEPEELLYKLRMMLPTDVAIASVSSVSSSFHARFSAVRRSYCYRILDRPDPFLARTALQRRSGRLDVASMIEATSALLGPHDFTTYSKINRSTPNLRCTVSECTIREEEYGLSISVSADRFLYGMVRHIVGRLLDVGQGRRSIESVALDLAARDRSLASMSVPARGLTLEGVGYPDDPFAAT